MAYGLEHGLTNWAAAYCTGLLIACRVLKNLGILKPEFEIRSNLIDTGMDICTPEVLALWSESFDANKPRSQFPHNILKNYELNGKTIHIEILKNKYAARVSNLQYYDFISKDIMSRFVHPFHPETNLPRDHKYQTWCERDV